MYIELEKIKEKLDENFNFLYCGSKKCKPEHSYGPGIRDHFLIHFIHGGSGTFYMQNKKYILGKNQGFLMWPYTMASHIADKDDPWEYSWFSFKGELAELFLSLANISKENPIFKYTKDNRLLEELEELTKNANSKTAGNLFSQLGQLYKIFSILIDNNDVDSHFDEQNASYMKYIELASEFISDNYSYDISIEDISKHVMLERKYLSSLFKKYQNITIHEYLQRVRMRKACELLTLNSELKINEVAQLVGYKDALYFSKVFKNHTGYSPKEYKNKVKIC